MAESLFVRADEVIRLLGVSKSEAYRIIKRLKQKKDIMYDPIPTDKPLPQKKPRTKDYER